MENLRRTLVFVPAASHNAIYGHDRRLRHLRVCRVRGSLCRRGGSGRRLGRLAGQDRRAARTSTGEGGRRRGMDQPLHALRAVAHCLRLGVLSAQGRERLVKRRSASMITFLAILYAVIVVVVFKVFKVPPRPWPIAITV